MFKWRNKFYNLIFLIIFIKIRIDINIRSLMLSTLARAIKICLIIYNYHSSNKKVFHRWRYKKKIWY